MAGQAQFVACLAFFVAWLAFFLAWLAFFLAWPDTKKFRKNPHISKTY